MRSKKQKIEGGRKKMKDKRIIKEGRNNKMRQKEIKKLNNKGITLIALVITIIVLLILARSINCYVNRRKWNFNTSKKGR